MKVLVVYDSVFGNTEKIAQAIGRTFQENVEVFKVNEVKKEHIEGIDLLIVGSPTYGGRPTQVMQNFLNEISSLRIDGVGIVAFDTRITIKLANIFGFAAPKIAEVLLKIGGHLVVPAEGFYVKGKEGPLKEGEMDRAANWAKEIIAKFLK